MGRLLSLALSLGQTLVVTEFLDKLNFRLKQNNRPHEDSLRILSEIARRNSRTDAQRNRNRLTNRRCHALHVTRAHVIHPRRHWVSWSRLSKARFGWRH